MLVRFHDTVYLHIKSRWFVWESAWSMFRPIDGLAWDGAKYIMNDTAYCSDPTSKYYGFGSEPMYTLCYHLTHEYSEKVADAPTVPSLTIGPSTWFFDRTMSLTPCAPTDKSSWRRAINGKRKTLRVLTRKTFTKRNLSS